MPPVYQFYSLMLTGDKNGCHDSDNKLIQTFRQGCPENSNDVQCAISKRKEIQKWLENHNRFKILITGKMGTGKTTFMKSLKERYIPEADHLLPHTLIVTPYEHIQDELEITFYDTPGLSTANHSDDHSVIEDMLNNTDKPDLIIFAIKMDDMTFQPEDMGVMENISHAFGSVMWENSMFILTFANRLYKPGVDVGSIENKIFYGEIRDHFSMGITKKLRECNVSDRISDNVPVVPVGLFTEPYITSDESGESWVNEFWIAVSMMLKASRQEKEHKCTWTCVRVKESSISYYFIAFITFVALAMVYIFFIE